MTQRFNFRRSMLFITGILLLVPSGCQPKIDPIEKKKADERAMRDFLEMEEEEKKNAAPEI